MKLFITGTDTDVGKTSISAWLAYHTGFSYFKPIQTGFENENTETDSNKIKRLTKVFTYPESYLYKAACSPHLAAKYQQSSIDIKTIQLPNEENLIIEGAGGLFVPLNEKNFMIDLIQQFQVPVILVARTDLGTINHTLLSLNALKERKIPILGVILNGLPNEDNKKAIEFYGQAPILACFPKCLTLDETSLKKIPLPSSLTYLLKGF